ncbi:MAG: M20/M25/M40 family metallo-hydrolase [Candidatus Omnitrophota bacterium]
MAVIFCSPRMAAPGILPRPYFLAKRISLLFLALSFSALNLFAEEEIEEHVKMLSAQIGPRNPAHYENLNRAADYIKAEFERYGYEPAEQVYAMSVVPAPGASFRNIIAVKSGAAKKDEVIIVCCHYDTHRVSPGADDNATGVAAVLELARLIRRTSLERTVKFIAFTNEELELVVQDKDMGSYRYAEAARKRGERIEGVICLDMLGFYSDKPGSQARPLVLMPFYPDKGNFIGMTSDAASYRLLMTTIREFKKASDMPLEYLVVPAPFLPQIMTSDNRSFWTFGYESVWISDTCIYRNTKMHTKEDTCEKLDYRNISRVVKGVYAVILKLAGEIKN